MTAKSKRGVDKKYLLRRGMFCFFLLFLFVSAFYFLFKPSHPEESLIERIFGEYKLIFFHSDEIEVAEEVERAKWDSDLFITDADGRIFYNDPNVVTCTGIDVSSFQGEIDWKKVKESGIDFVFIRAGYRGNTEGGLYVDPSFETNYQGARDVGLPIGVYFFSQAISEEEAAEEADYVVSIIGNRTIDLPIVFDWEYVSEAARTAGISSTTMSNCAHAFCNRVSQRGYDSMVYFNLYTSYMIYDMSSFGNNKIWIAQFAEKPTYYYHYEMWQYSCTGTVPGISTEVDLNIALDQALVDMIKK